MSRDEEQHQKLLRRAKDREIVTPEEYQRIFAEGGVAYLTHGTAANSPYLVLTVRSAVEAVRSHAWEQGWWHECRKEANRVTGS